MTRKCLLLALWAYPLALPAQTNEALQAILDRLEAIERQNRELTAELRALRAQLATARQPAAAGQTAAAPTVVERLEVQERRVEELEQSKVQSDYRYPVQLTGMALFNSYWNGRGSGGNSHPTTLPLEPGTATAGGTFRQSVLGLKFQGPAIAGGGRVKGSLMMDFFAGTGTSLNQLMRVRIASVDFDWQRTTLSFAQDKPIIAPREPTSLAQVGVSALTQSGNLWLWQPQIRVEHRYRFSDVAGLRAQGGLYFTSETVAGLPPELTGTLQRTRPGYQGRLEFWQELAGGRRFEIAPSAHWSRSHVAGGSAPSRIYSVDWFVQPLRQVDLLGQVFTGENVGVVGGGRPSISFFPDGRIQPIRANGGWTQFTWRLHRVLSFNAFAGQQSNQPNDLLAGAIRRNRSYGANLMYRIGGNVVASLEASQIRTTYQGSGTRIAPRYDLAIAYLF